MQERVQTAVDALETGHDEDAAMLFTGGKDSMVMLHLWREHLDHEHPPLLAIDTGNQFESIYDFREDIQDDWGVDITTYRNDHFLGTVINNPADPRGFAGQRDTAACPDCGAELLATDTAEDYTCPDCDFGHVVNQDRDTLSEWGEDGGVVQKYDACCGRLKIDVIGDIIRDGNDTLLVGRRSADVGHDLPMYDEDYREPAPHDRIHPLADWSDAHIKAYIKKHQVPLPDVYDEGYEHTDCVSCVGTGEEGDDWSGVSQEKKEQLNQLRDMGYM
jgi:3'-phosphoadenosine 5'-phosphosulfate sulfotransferase (PAPS reductase)/FAD synthetase